LDSEAAKASEIRLFDLTNHGKQKEQYAADQFFRSLLKEAGEQASVWLGGTLDYSKYLRVRTQNSWSGWPVYLIPPFLLLGVGFIICGLVLSS
jgi:hypothetical protein